MSLYMESEHPQYSVGDVARFTVTLDFESDPAMVDAWMTPTVSVLVDGKPQGTDQYPDYPMHESRDETKRVGWFVHPLLRGTWGTYRAEALVYEAERQEIGRVHVDFEVIRPEDEGE
jgi:hypothetical protein